MGIQSAIVLCCSLAIFRTTDAQACAETEGTCGSSLPEPRSGGIMFQTKTQTTPSQHMHQKRVKEVVHQPSDPGQPMLSLSNRVAAVTERMTQLEQQSGEGREALRAGLESLKADTSTVSADMDVAKARIASAEGSLSALEGVVGDNNAVLRTELGALHSNFEELGKRVGQQWSAMLQSWTVREDPAAEEAAAPEAAAEVTETAPAPPPPAPAFAASSGEALSSQVGALEGRCTALEEDSGNGRLEMKTELDAVEGQINDIQAGGADSLENSIDRIGSAETQLSSLASSVDEQGGDLSANLAEVKQKLEVLGKRLGSGQLLESKSTPTKKHVAKSSPKKAAVDAQQVPTLPLTSRIASLETRVGLLEEKSNEGRGDLQIQLDRLNTLVATIKKGGVQSLAHTVMRVTAMETEILSLTETVESQKNDITMETDNLKSMLASLSAQVGGARA